MKHLMGLIFTLILIACQSVKEKQADDADQKISNSHMYTPLENEASSDDENYHAALDFLNGYIENRDDLEILEFVKSSPLATSNLKQALEELLIKAWEENPAMGLGFDPLFDAQDFPAEGVELHHFDPITGYVLVKGIEWDDFKVAMRVVEEQGHILVDGCGVVNIPANKRAER